MSFSVDRFGCALHAYCLMPNHVHLLVTPETPAGCSGLMKHVARLQTQYMNRAYKRTGALWEGRHRSCVVQSERYLLTCYRSIELNPVRAGLVQHPHDEYVRLGATEAERKRAYAELVAGGIEENELDDIRLSTHIGQALGDRAFRRGLSRVRPGSVPDRV